VSQRIYKEATREITHNIEIARCRCFVGQHMLFGPRLPKFDNFSR
jgi:hypothetical protein